MLRSLRLLFSVALVSLPGITNASDKLFLTGAEVTNSSSSYLYLGTAIPLPDSTLAKGYVFHLWADYSTYAYDASSTDIDATVYSLSASIGYHDSGTGYWWNTQAGLIQSDTSLSPDDPGNDSNGMETGIKLQLEGERQLTEDSKINGNLALVSRRGAYWARVRYLMRNDDETYHGPELILQGDTNYEAQQVGWVLTQIPLSSWSLGIKAGFRLDDGDVSEYAGVELGVLY
ncbi:MAG: cellulose biosynthesis protein BcsS [Gammaproteobacteria bacterium]|nr:cellulose biosynthesis protein BcsS [Gammaproteobacteria bacterium]